MDNIKNLSTDIIKPHLGVWTCGFYSKFNVYSTCYSVFKILFFHYD